MLIEVNQQDNELVFDFYIKAGFFTACKSISKDIEYKMSELERKRKHMKIEEYKIVYYDLQEELKGDTYANWEKAHRNIIVDLVKLGYEVKKEVLPQEIVKITQSKTEVKISA